MAFFTADSKTDFQGQLRAALAAHLDERQLSQVALFAEQFFAIAALDELVERRLADLVGCTLSAWRLLERFGPAQPQVQVFNPDYEKHGWQSSHSVVQVLHPDMPFLVDSLRMELNRGGHGIHNLQSSVLGVRRDAAGALVEILPRGAEAEGACREALIFAEIDRCASLAEQRELEQRLLEIFGEVRLAVGDFVAMTSCAQALLDWLGRAPLKVDAEELAEEGGAGTGETGDVQHALGKAGVWCA